MSRKSIALLAGPLLLATTLSGRGQTTPPQAGSTATIAGHVVDEAGHAVIDAVVTLAARGGAVDRVVVDPRGRFVFRGLPAGVFGITATRPGYFGGGMDQRDPTSAARPLEVAPNDAAGDVTLRLSRAGAITGTVTGDFGDPLPGVEIHALRRALIGGRWIISIGPTVSTDDLGRYRIDGLQPGDYAVVARPDRDPETALLLAMLAANPAVSADVMAGLVTTRRARPEVDDRVRNYAMTFYPDSPAFTAASLITIAPGAERAKTDFRLRASRAVHVSGMIANAAAAADGITLQLLPVDASGTPAPLDAAVTACDEDGRFEFSGVSPGRYVIAVPSTPPPTPAAQPGPAPASPALPATPAWSARVPIVVGATDVTGVSVPLAQGAVMSGHLSFEGAAVAPTPAQLSQVTLRLDPADRAVPAGGPTWRGQVLPDGRFTTMSLPPGEYLLRIAGAPRGWTALSATYAGHDLLDEPIAVTGTAIENVTVTFTDRPMAGVAGNVHDTQGGPASDATVLVFPADRAWWRDASAQSRRLRLVRPTTAGHTGIQGLPPGEYSIVAISGELPAEWQDPDRLAALSRQATRATLTFGATQPIDLTAIALPGLSAPSRVEGKTRPASDLAAVRRADLSGPPSAGPERPGLRTKSAPDPTHAATITGTVIDQLTHRPSANALAIVAGTDVGVVRVTATDARGRFTFTGLPSGHFLVGAGKPSYLPAVYGAERPGRPGLPIALEPGGQPRDVTLAMIKGAVISGRVTGDGGQPVPGARVRVVQHRVTSGEVAMNGDAGEPAVVTTDDLGAYRVFGLPPGEYAVAVQGRGFTGGDVRRLTETDVDGTTAYVPAQTPPANGMALGWAPAYFPGTSSPANAEAIAIAPGATRTNVDVHLALARLVRVEGTISGVDSTTPANLQVTLRPRGLSASGVVLTNLTTRPGADGRFQFANVPPGDYTVAARSLPPPVPPDRQGAGPLPFSPATVRWAAADVRVKEENVAGVTLALHAGLSVTGAIQFPDNSHPLNLPLIRVGIRPTPGSAVQPVPDPVIVGNDGRFTIEGLVPGRYRVYVQVPNNDVLQVPEWFARDASVEGLSSGDPLDLPFDIGPGDRRISIVLTNATQELDGLVHTAAGKAAADCVVVAFPVEPGLWMQPSRRIVTRQSNRDGRFVFGIGAGLPAGDYFVAAVPDGRPGEPLDPLLLAELSATAVKVTLGPNDSKTVDVRIK